MKKIVIGVDEAGRGCLAGSVFAAALCFGDDTILPDVISKFKDSKLFSEKARFGLYELIKSNNILYCISSKSASEIDETDILKSTLAAMRESIFGLIQKISNVYKNCSVEVIVDGNCVPYIEGVDITAVVKADRDFSVVSAASIVAKCEKDIEAYKIHEEFPQYGFARHKCYGTSEHIDALAKYGTCKYHRMSYAPIKELKYSRGFHEVKNIILKTPRADIESVFFEKLVHLGHALEHNEILCLKKIYAVRVKKEMKR